MQDYPAKIASIFCSETAPVHFTPANVSQGKKPFPHHVVYDNYVAIEIIIFLTQSWHTSYVCILYSCVITVQQIGGKQKGNRSFGNP